MEPKTKTTTKKKTPTKAPAKKATAKPKRVTLRNTKASNGMIGAIATPLHKDAAKWRANGWIDAD